MCFQFHMPACLTIVTNEFKILFWWFVFWQNWQIWYKTSYTIIKTYIKPLHSALALKSNDLFHYSKYRGFTEISKQSFIIGKWKLRLTKWDVRSPEEYLNAAASPAQRETRATHCGTCSKTQWRQCGREESHYPQHLHSHQSIVLFVASLWTVCLRDRNKGRWTPSSTLEIRPLIRGYWCRTWPCNRGESSPGHTGLLLVHEKYMRRSRKLEGVPRPKWKSSAHSSHCVCVRESEFAHGCVVCGWVHVHQMSHIFYEPAVLAI